MWQQKESGWKTADVAEINQNKSVSLILNEKM
jgi:hypothetical protein